MNAKRMWHLIAELVQTYAQEGDLDKAVETLERALSTEPMWIPHALFDPRTTLIRELPAYKELTAIPPDDAPAFFNAAIVALEYQLPDRALDFLAQTFELSAQDGTLPYLLEALNEEEIFQPYRAQPSFAALLEEYRDAGQP